MRPARFLLLLPLLTLAPARAAEPPLTAAPAVTATTSSAMPGDADSTADVPPPPFVYMITRIKLTDTDLTQVAFFSHPEIKTLEACETERNAGLTTGWQRYFNGYYLKTLKGFSYRVDYRCIGSEQQLYPWRQGMPLDSYYLVQTRDNKLVLTPHSNFFACRTTLRQIGAAEDIDNFCAASSQAIFVPRP